MKALLLSGGRGTRMRPLTFTRNKHAIHIANKPLIEYPFKLIVDAGIKEIAVIVNETKEEIEAILGNGKKWGVKITYIFQNEPKGLAHALSLGKDFMGNEKFVMVLGDNILEKGISTYVEKFEKDKNLHAFLLGVEVPRKEHKRFGMVTIDKSGNVLRYIEKPGIIDKSKLYNPNRSFAVPGFYFFDQNVFKCFTGKDKIKPSIRGELEIASPYNWLIKNGFKVKMEKVTGWYKDPGNPEDTLTTNQILLTSLSEIKNFGKIDKKSKLEGKVSIDKGSKIINSKIRGPVIIGKNCIIKNSFVGPYTSVYDNVKIEKCEIENSIILGSVELKNINKRIDSSIIGWNAKIQNGSMNFSTSMSLFIGDNSEIQL